MQGANMNCREETNATIVGLWLVDGFIWVNTVGCQQGRAGKLLNAKNLTQMAASRSKHNEHCMWSMLDRDWNLRLQSGIRHRKFTKMISSKFVYSGSEYDLRPLTKKLLKERRYSTNYLFNQPVVCLIRLINGHEHVVRDCDNRCHFKARIVKEPGM